MVLGVPAAGCGRWSGSWRCRRSARWRSCARRSPSGPGAAYAFHREPANALGLPDAPDGDATDPADLAHVERWCAGTRPAASPTPGGRALWASTRGLLASRLPGPLAPLAPAVAASLLDDPLRAALGVRRPPPLVRALVARALRAKARAGRSEEE